MQVRARTQLRKHQTHATFCGVFRYSAERKALEALDNCITSLSITSALTPDKPYAGMGKEDLLRFSQTPFWNRFRLICTVSNNINNIFI